MNDRRYGLRIALSIGAIVGALFALAFAAAVYQVDLLLVFGVVLVGTHAATRWLWA